MRGAVLVVVMLGLGGCSAAKPRTAPEPLRAGQSTSAEIGRACDERERQWQASLAEWRAVYAEVNGLRIAAENDWFEANLLNQDFAAENAYLIALLRSHNIEPDPRDVERLQLQSRVRRMEASEQWRKAREAQPEPQPTEPSAHDL